ncbi:Asp-tRNA(Asn)/Glu-tRNA(Gln) amidotransferase subunit GatA [Candidatus Roizmanbacteria bacterium]|nr:Asp-tRNA(Asn)/Glu-tRNA(Gln) amidotransferase subunit GatA [Candidatus Roizmanbacteria bacterium]
MKLFGKSLLELKKLVTQKEVSAPEVSSYFRKRIAKYNGVLNAFLSVVAEDGGLPIGVKDNFCTRGVRTTASAKVLDDFIPPYESTVTDRLKKNQLTVIGKTNMDAWAHGSSTETSDYGPTKNPWDTTRAPGGSSGGSAAAVSAYLAPAAIGSETAGSIRQPASWCGVVGLKPTFGRVSRYGVVAMGSSFDCPGPITATVEDAAFILGLIAGRDRYDATSSPRPVPDYLSSLAERRKLTVGVAEEYFDSVNVEVKAAVEKAVEIFQKLGHRVKKVRLLSPKYSISVYTVLQRAEVSSNLARYDGIRYGGSRAFFAAEAKKRIMLGAYTLSYGYYDAFYKKAQKVRTLIIKNFKEIFNDVDVIISPTAPITALKLGEFEKYPFFGEVMDILNEPAAVAGIPAVNIPCGTDTNGLPIGLQIMGNYFKEETLLSLAYQFEKETEFFGVIKKGIENYKDD